MTFAQTQQSKKALKAAAEAAKRKEEAMVHSITGSQDSDVAVIGDTKDAATASLNDNSSRAVQYVEAAYVKLKIRIQDFSKERAKSVEWLEQVEDRLDNVRQFLLRILDIFYRWLMQFLTCC